MSTTSAYPFDPVNTHTSYTPHYHHDSPSYTSPSSSTSTLCYTAISTATATAMPITRPTPAYTSSPYIFERNPDLPKPDFGPNEELTPPPSPQNSKATIYNSAASATNTTSQKLAPLLTRAGSVLSSKRSQATSTFVTPTNSRPVSPAKSASISTTTAHGGPDKKNKPISSSFADFFQPKGSSAPISFGLVSLSPKKESLPSTSVFGPPLRPSSGNASEHSSRDVSPHTKRPGLSHIRRGSTIVGAAANFLILSSPSKSPLREQTAKLESEDEKDDEFLNLDLQKQLLPDNVEYGDFDALLANASTLFSRMQHAYRTRRHDERRERQANAEESAEQRMRAEHLKTQLGALAEQVELRNVENEILRAQLDQRRERAGMIRVVDSADLDGTGGGDDDDKVDGNEEAALTRPSSASSAMTAEAGVAAKPWRSSSGTAAPFLPPSEMGEMARENQRLLRRVRELEDVLGGCLGLVDP